MNADITSARHNLKTFEREEQITISKEVRQRLIHSKSARKDLSAYNRHIGTIEFYEKHIPSMMARLYAHYETCINEKIWSCGERAQEMIQGLSRNYDELEEARNEAAILRDQILLYIED
mgnify:CR=1 FL=1